MMQNDSAQLEVYSYNSPNNGLNVGPCFFSTLQGFGSPAIGQKDVEN